MASNSTFFSMNQQDPLSSFVFLLLNPDFFPATSQTPLPSWYSLHFLYSSFLTPNSSLYSCFPSKPLPALLLTFYSTTPHSENVSILTTTMTRQQCPWPSMQLAHLWKLSPTPKCNAQLTLGWLASGDRKNKNKNENKSLSSKRGVYTHPLRFSVNILCHH